ncbi:probable WRKY transcription factor 13 [Vicia villosa]|uniref:probable WRKY transcription factor 13 n=1 Tax=Vicia villosa TaxID=3911 RepID=UPI00273BFBDB|nr:probable WRKY transcription factor 13 [Vicia villosa]
MSEIVINNLFEEHIPTPMGFIPLPTNLTFPSLGCNNQSLKPFTSIASSLTSEISSDSTSQTLLTTTTNPQKSKEYLTPSFEDGTTQFLSLQRSTLNPWAILGGGVGDHYFNNNNNDKRSGVVHDNYHLGVCSTSSMKMKKMKGRKKVREPRFCFKTLSADVDVLDDGYKWRKYGQKVVKNTQHPRSYYRCTQENCRVKKRVERLGEDPRMVITTYEGRHVHTPSNELEDSQNQSQFESFLW